MNKVEVSIILPAFNAEKFILKTIKSILLQSFPHFELIIINDGSTDRTEQIISTFDDKRINYIKNETNIGLIKSLNKGFELASGNYIARIDADDMAHPKRIERQITFLKKLAKPAIVGSNVIIINQENQIVKIPRQVQLKPNENFWIKFRKNPIMHPTVMMSKEIVSQFTPFYHLDDLHVEDYAAWIRANDQFPIYNLKQPLLFYRMHTQNITKVSSIAQTQNVISLLKKHYEKTFQHKEKIATLKSLLFLKLMDHQQARDVFHEITENGQLFIQIYGDSHFVKNDMAYSIFNIGLKSSLPTLAYAITFILQKLGFLPLLYAIKLTATEAARSIVLKIFYKFIYADFLKGTL